MKVLFYTRGVEQLGVEYLMSYLKKRGHEVELLFDPGLDNNLYYRLGLLRPLNRRAKRLSRVEEWKPDLVAFSSLTNLFPFALEFARELKKRIDAPFVFGGIHPTALPEYVLRHHEIDYVIRGEGEEALAELAETLERGDDVRGIRNLCFREGDEVKQNPLRPLIADLDALPFPRKQEFFREGAFTNQLHVITARGCPFQCSYCINNFYRKKLYKECEGPAPPVRRRSPGNVIEEVMRLVDRYPVDHIYFCDEVFILDKDWLFDFLDRYRDQVRGVTFSFSYFHRFIDDEVAARIAEAGGTFAQGAIETANHDLRHRVLNRRETDEEILAAMEALRRHGIGVSTSAIFGIPHETEQSRWETVEMVERSVPDMINTYLMYPFPGTEIERIALEDGFLSEENWEKVKMGLSSYHQESLLQNLDLDNAATMAKLLPLYIRGPRLLKPLVRRMMRTRMPRLAHLIYVATSPFIYSGWALNWIGNLLNMFYYNLTGKRRKR